MTREEFEALLEEAYEEGSNAAYSELEDAIQEAEMFDSDEIEIVDEDSEFDEFDFDMDEEAYTEALALKKRLNNVPSPREAYQGIKDRAKSVNFKKGIASFRKRVLGSKAGKSIARKYDDAHKALLKTKAAKWLRKKSI